MLKKLFIFAGWLLLLCLVFLFCCSLGFWHGWRTSTILVVWLIVVTASVLLWIALLWLTQLFKENKLHRLFQRYRLSRREFVLFQHWKSGRSVLKRIQSKRPPIPWYLLLGDRCGKTSLLAGADLPMFSNGTQDNVVVPTYTLRWWFFHNVSVLDLSANFLNGAPTFQRAWKKMVGWISRAPAPSGIMIGLSVTDLINEDVSVLHEKARKIRAQIAPLTSKTKRRLPIYIIVTRCDKFPAFSLWVKQLSAAQHQQALGYYWPTAPDIDGKDVSMLRPLFATLRKGFERVRLSMIGTDLSADDRCALLAFPESFAKLEGPLRVFMASLCEPNAYFPQAMLGGVWFTASESHNENKSRRTAYFVHDLLTKHLPEFSTSRDIQCPRVRKMHVAAGYLLLSGYVAALGYSALKSQALMVRDDATLSSSQLADSLINNEARFQSPLIYLPFSMGLSHQHSRLEQRLLEKLPPVTHRDGHGLLTYQQQFADADAQVKRQMVLDLADTILTRKAMREGATLETLSLRPIIPENLRIETVNHSASALSRLALERIAMQQPSGAELLASLQQLLSVLINHDRELSWLTSPIDTLPDVETGYLWTNKPDAPVLSGIWTQQGETQLREWIVRISLADGHTEREPVLEQFLQALPAKRQNAWRELLFSVNAFIERPSPASLSQKELIAIGEGNSPAMQFARRVAFELSGIPSNDLQPWVMELKRLQSLPSRADEKPILKKLQQMDAKLRGSFSKWQSGRMMAVDEPSDMQQIMAWKNWQTSLNTVTSMALSQTILSPELTHGLFTPQAEDKNINPMITLFAHFDELIRTVEPRKQELGVEAIGTLYQADANALLGHAMSRSSCWLNEQWQNKVLWPIRKNAQRMNYDDQQELTWQYLVDFMRGPAKGLLAASAQGPQAAEFRGHTLPLTESFMVIARHQLNPEDLLEVPLRQSTQSADRISGLRDQIQQLTLRQKEMEAKAYSVSIISQPATVLEGARLIPTGSQLTLECQSGIKVLDSMNFADQAQFTWRPGECQSVQLKVKFPDFSATYRYTGPDAWPEFLRQFIHGEALIDVSDFDDNQDVMTALNIKQVLLRFKISDQSTLQMAWKDWSMLDDQLAALEEEKLALEEQQNLKPASAMRGQLSTLPENAAICQ